MERGYLMFDRLREGRFGRGFRRRPGGEDPPGVPHDPARHCRTPDSLGTPSDREKPDDAGGAPAPEPLPPRRLLGCFALRACSLVGAAVVLCVSPIASYLFCKAIIAILNRLFSIAIPYPCEGNWIVDTSFGIVALAAIVIEVCIAVSGSQPLRRALDWRVGQPKSDGLPYYEMEEWEFTYHNYGLTAQFFLRLWTVVRTALQWFWTVIALHVGVLLVVVLVPAVVAIVLGMAVMLSTIICAIGIWILNCLPGVAITLPFHGSLIVNIIVFVLAVPMIVVVLIGLADMGEAAEGHPFLTGFAIGSVIASSMRSGGD